MVGGGSSGGSSSGSSGSSGGSSGSSDSGGKSGGTNSTGGDSTGGDSGGDEDDCDDSGSSSGGSKATGGAASIGGGRSIGGAGPRLISLCDDGDDDDDDDDKDDDDDADDCRDDKAAYRSGLTTGASGSGRYTLASAAAPHRVLSSGRFAAGSGSPSPLGLMATVSGFALPGIDRYQDVEDRLTNAIGLTDPPPPPIKDDPDPQPEPSDDCSSDDSDDPDDPDDDKCPVIAAPGRQAERGGVLRVSAVGSGGIRNAADDCDDTPPPNKKFGDDQSKEQNRASIDDLNPGEGFTGVWQPGGKMRGRLSGDAEGALVNRRGGHAKINREDFGNADDTVGFAAIKKPDGNLEVTFISGLNLAHFGGRTTVPEKFKKEIIEELADITGLKVEEKT